MSHSFEPYTIVVDENDANVKTETWILDKVTEGPSGWDIQHDGWGGLLPRLNGWGEPEQTAPKVGDKVTVYLEGFNSIVGMALNDEVVYYRTAAQREVHRRRMLEDTAAREERRNIREAPERAAMYLSLSDPMRRRIDRLRAAKEPETPGMSWEAYELFILSQSDRLYDHFVGQEDAVDKLNAWKELSYDLQVANCPEGFDLGQHSGNTFGCAVMFARARLEGMTEF